MTRRARLVLTTVALAAVVLVGGYLSFAVGTISTMYSDPCGANDQQGLICSPRVQAIVFFLPLGGWLVAVVLMVAGVVRLVRRDQGPWRPMALGVGILLTTIAIAVGIAEQPVGG